MGEPQSALKIVVPKLNLYFVGLNQATLRKSPRKTPLFVKKHKTSDFLISENHLEKA